MRRFSYLLLMPGAFLGLETNPHLFRLPQLFAIPREIVKVSQGFTGTNSIAGTWSGHYYCAQGLTSLHLDVRHGEDNAVHAIFTFSEHPNNRGVPSGSFQMQGKIENGNQIILKGGEWIRRPINYGVVNLDGRINFKNNWIDGNVTGRGGRCTTFSLSRRSSIPSTLVPNTPLLKRILQSVTPKNQPAFNERKLEKKRKALDIQQIILELDSKGSTISTRDLLDGYEYLIGSSVEIGEILAIANKDYTLGEFFDSAGKITDSIAVARLIIDFASIHRSLRSGDKGSAVVKLLEIGLSKNLMADIYLKLSGQDVKKDIATIFNINKVRDLLGREIDGHFDKMPRIRELILNLEQQSPYAAFEKELQDAGLWLEWQKYLTSDIARNYNSIF